MIKSIHNLNSQLNNINSNSLSIPSFVDSYLHSSSSASTMMDHRPTKRRRPAAAPSLLVHTAADVPAIPTPPLSSATTSNIMVPLTPDTPSSLFPPPSQPQLPLHWIQSSMYFPSTPITPISSLDHVHHHHQQQHQHQHQHQHHSHPQQQPPLHSSHSVSHLSSSSNYSYLSNSTSIPNNGVLYSDGMNMLIDPPLSSNSTPSTTTTNTTTTSPSTYRVFGSGHHTIELAHLQTVLSPTPSNIFLVAEHRGLVPSRISSFNSSSSERISGDGVVAVVPNSSLELIFNTEGRVQPTDHFLSYRTNMGGGTNVATARTHTIKWLMELNRQHKLFRYKVNTMCVAVKYMDRFLDCLAQEGRAMDTGCPPAVTITAINGTCGPLHSAVKPAMLSQWRSYDWYLLAIVCLSVSAKMVEEYDDPTMRDMVSLDFHSEHIRQLQISLTKTLRFDLSSASPVNFCIEYLALSPIRDLVAELLPQHRNRSSDINGLGGNHSIDTSDGTTSPSSIYGHGLATPPLSPPPSSTASPSIYTSIGTSPSVPMLDDIVLTPAPSADLEQFQDMVAPPILDKIQSVAEQYLLMILPCPESASFAPSELAMAALNLALEIRSLMVNARIRIHPITGARHVDYLPKSLALGFYGAPMTGRTNVARDLMLRVLPRERFFCN